MSTGEKLVKFIFFGGIFLSPFIFIPWFDRPFELPRVWFIQRWIEVMGISGSMMLLQGNFTGNLNRNIQKTLIIYIIAAFITSIFGADFGKSIWGNPYRADGLITLFHLAGLAIFISIFWEDKWKKLFSRLITTGSLLISVWTIIEFIWLLITGGVKSAFAQNVYILTSFGHPNFIAGYLAVTFPFVLYFLLSLRRKTCRFLLLIQVVAVMVTQSWGGIATLFIFFTYYFLLHLCRKYNYPSKYLLYAVPFILIFIISIYVSTHRTDHFSPDSRERIIVKLLMAINERPITGWGWANADFAFESVVWPRLVENDIYLDKAHSHILEAFTAGGLSLGITYLIFLWLILKKLYHQALKSSPYSFENVVFYSLIIYIFHSQMNVISISEEVIFWIIAGISLRETKNKII